VCLLCCLTTSCSRATCTKRCRLTTGCTSELAVNAAGGEDGRSKTTRTIDKKRKLNNDEEQFIHHAGQTPKKPLLSTSTSTTKEEEEKEEYENTIVALEIAHTLLCKDRIDAKQLGLESLCFLTDPSKNETMLSTKIIASRVILFGTAGLGPPKTETLPPASLFQEIQDKILSLIKSNRFATTAAAEEKFETATASISSNDDQIRNLALKIFANALEVMCSNNGGNNINHDMNRKGCDDVISTLATELSNAERISPHTVYLSVRCLRLLCALSNDTIKQKILSHFEGTMMDNKNNNIDIIHKALDIGICTHRKLELECQKFLEDCLLPSN